MTDIPVIKWSVDHVCAWVGSQNFRAYKHIFREGLISGRTLLALDHAILEVCKIHQLICSHMKDGLTQAIFRNYMLHHSHHDVFLFQKLRITEHTHSTAAMQYLCEFSFHHQRRDGDSVLHRGSQGICHRKATSFVDSEGQPV